MKDTKLEERVNKYQKSNIDILNTRQNHKLRLRKTQIENFITERREKMFGNAEKSKFEINPDNLILPSEILNKDEAIEFIGFLLKSSDINYIKFGVLHLRKQLILEVNPPIVEVIGKEYHSKLLDILDTYITNDQIVYEIIWCFTNMTSNEHQITGFFLNPKALRLFDIIINSSQIEIVYNLIWLITHICDTKNARDVILYSNLFNKILLMLENDNVHMDVVKHGIWMISTLSKQMSGEMKDGVLFERIIRVVCFYMRALDCTIVTDILHALSHLTESPFSFTFKILLDTGVVSYLMQLDINSPKVIVESTLRIYGNLLTGDDQMTDELIQYGIIEMVGKLLSHESPSVRREAAWNLSNIAAGTKGQINALIDSKLIPNLSELVKDPHLDVAREAAWVFSNMMSGADLEIAFKLGQFGAVEPLIFVLQHHLEPSIIGIALEGLRKLFDQGEVVNQLGGTNSNPFVNFFIREGGLEPLEKLQTHTNFSIYTLTVEILEQFFACSVINN